MVLKNLRARHPTIQNPDSQVIHIVERTLQQAGLPLSTSSVIYRCFCGYHVSERVAGKLFQPNEYHMVADKGHVCKSCWPP